MLLPGLQCCAARCTQHCPQAQTPEQQDLPQVPGSPSCALAMCTCQAHCKHIMLGCSHARPASCQEQPQNRDYLQRQALTLAAAPLQTLHLLALANKRCGCESFAKNPQANCLLQEQRPPS